MLSNRSKGPGPLAFPELQEKILEGRGWWPIVLLLGWGQPFSALQVPSEPRGLRPDLQTHSTGHLKT